MRELVRGIALAIGSAIAVSFAFAEDKRAPGITALTASPDGLLILAATQAGVFRQEESGLRPIPLASSLEHLHAMAFSPDAKTLAIAGGKPAEMGVLELWSWPRAALVARLAHSEDVFTDVVWLDADRLAMAGSDHRIYVWNWKKRALERTLEGHSGPVASLALSPDRRVLCSGSQDQSIRVWDLESGKCLRSLDNHLGSVNRLASRPSSAGEGSAWLASAGSDATVRIWQPSVGRLVRMVRLPAPVQSIAWSADGSQLFAGCRKGVLHTIDPDLGRPISSQSISTGWIQEIHFLSGKSGLMIGDSNGKVQQAPAHK